jgi:hypothetical protein
MRAREFIVESQSELNPFYADPMKYTYILPDVKSSDPYQVYRLGVAFARARAEQDPTAVFDQDWTTETAFSNDAIVSGFDSRISDVIDRGLEMIGKKNNKELISSAESAEPDFVKKVSPIKSFAGYPR